MEKEMVFLREDEVVEDSKIGGGSLAFDAAEFIERERGVEGAEKALEVGDGGRDLRRGGEVWMIAEGALKDRAGVGDFGGEDGAGDLSGTKVVIGVMILSAAEEDVPADGAAHGGEEAAVFAEKAEGNAVFCAEVHELWRTRDLAETNDAVDGMNGEADAFFMVYAHDDVKTVLAEIGALRGDVEGVEVRFHSERA